MTIRCQNFASTILNEVRKVMVFSFLKFPFMLTIIIVNCHVNYNYMIQSSKNAFREKLIDFWILTIFRQRQYMDITFFFSDPKFADKVRSKRSLLSRVYKVQEFSKPLQKLTVHSPTFNCNKKYSYNPCVYVFDITNM